MDSVTYPVSRPGAIFGPGSLGPMESPFLHSYVEELGILTRWVSDLRTQGIVVSLCLVFVCALDFTDCIIDKNVCCKSKYNKES